MMRFETHEAHVYLVNRLLSSTAVKEVKTDAGEIIELALHSGQQVTIYLIERFIDLDYVQSTLKLEGGRQVHSLFILWEEMLLPAHQTWYKPNDWMVFLQALHGGKIYGYRPNGSTYTRMFPVYLENCIDTEVKCFVQFGKSVNFDQLVGRAVQTALPYAGVWYVADFDGSHATTYAQPKQNGKESSPPPPVKPIPEERLALRLHFQVLGVALDADVDTIRQAYRDRARQMHPDVNQNSQESKHTMQRINEAYTQIMSQLKLK
jgi:hypothetical protein